MTTLYRPVLIESAEQAEALPVNTLAISADRVDPAIRKEDGWHGIFGDPPYSHAEMVSDYAFVPIEAEEVNVVASGLLELDMHGRADVNHDVTDPRTYRRTEYLTPWEEA